MSVYMLLIHKGNDLLIRKAIIKVFYYFLSVFIATDSVTRYLKYVFRNTQPTRTRLYVLDGVLTYSKLSGYTNYRLLIVESVAYIYDSGIGQYRPSIILSHPILPNLTPCSEFSFGVTHSRLDILLSSLIEFMWFTCGLLSGLGINALATAL